MKTMRWVFSFILSLMLALLLVLLQVLVLIDVKILNSDYYISKYEEKGLYTYTYNNVNNSLEKISRTSNLPIDLFSNIITKKFIKNKTDFSTRELINYVKYKDNNVGDIDTKPLSDKFNSNLDDYISKQNFVQDNNVQNELNNIKVGVANSLKYQSSVADFKKASKSSSFTKLRQGFHYFNYVKLVLAILAVVNIVLLFFVVKKPQGSVFIWIGYSFLVGGLLTLIPAVIGLNSGFFNNISITKGALKNVVVAIFKDSIGFFVYSGGILIALSFICFIFVIVKSLYFSERKYDN